MKKILVVLSIVVFMFSCTSSVDTKDITDSTKNDTIKVDTTKKVTDSTKKAEEPVVKPTKETVTKK